MTDAWTVIVGFVGMFVGLVAVIGALFTFQTRWIKAQFDGVNARFDGADTRFESVNDKIDRLDRDVHAVIVHLMGGDR